MIKNKTELYLYINIMYTGGAVYSFVSRLLKTIISEPIRLVNRILDKFGSYISVKGEVPYVADRKRESAYNERGDL
jgi:hypothetical protein